jgi:serine protease Do
MKGISVTVLAGCIALTPAVFAQQHWNIMADDPALLSHSTQGYLGVGTHDIDTQRAGQLKLKDTRGAEVVTIDHDAPAAKAGMRLHDVILQMNGQQIEGEAQLGQLLRQTPPGKTVTLVISRDGQPQTLSVTLCDEATLEADAWSQHIPVEPDENDDLTLPGPKSGFGNGFLPSLRMNTSYTGLELDMLGPQLADFFGVHDGQGLLVKRVDDNSPGSVAGLRAGDVITKVNGRIVATTGQWMRTIRTSKGKPVELTVMRDRREATVTMTAGRGKSRS